MTAWSSAESLNVGRALLGSWPGTITTWGRDAFDAYLYILQARGLEAQQVLTAIATWPAGSDFPPSAPNLAAAAMRDPSKPTFAEMCVIVFGSHGVLRARTPIRKAFWEPGERSRADLDAMSARASEQHPLIAGFIRTQGIERLRSLDLQDERYGEVRRRQLEQEWSEFIEAHDGREVAALASGRRGELAAFDPLAVLRAAHDKGEQPVPIPKRVSA